MKFAKHWLDLCTAQPQTWFQICWQNILKKQNKYIFCTWLNIENGGVFEHVSEGRCWMKNKHDQGGPMRSLLFESTRTIVSVFSVITEKLFHFWRNGDKKKGMVAYFCILVRLSDIENFQLLSKYGHSKSSNCSYNFADFRALKMCWLVTSTACVASSTRARHCRSYARRTQCQKLFLVAAHITIVMCAFSINISA